MAYMGKYNDPMELLNDPAVERTEKVKMLETWRDDKKAYLRASGEGMDGDDKAELLRQIKKALASLEGQA